MAPATIATAHSGRISHSVSASRLYRTLHIRNAAPAPIRTGIVAAVTATTISCHLLSTFSSPVHKSAPADDGDRAQGNAGAHDDDAKPHDMTSIIRGRVSPRRTVTRPRMAADRPPTSQRQT
jgi:hypothetical protein